MVEMKEPVKDLSLDPAEVEMFSKITDEWWDGFVLLHKMNHVRVPFVNEGLLRTGVIKEGSVSRGHIKMLEVGCGGGILSEALAAEGYTVTAIDPSGEVIEIAKNHAKKYPNLKLNYEQTTIKEFADANPNKYDVVVTSEVVEHVNDPKAFLQECTAALKPGGSLFVTTIARTIWAWMVYILLFEYILRIIPIGTHQWSKLICSSEVRKILEEENCRVVLTKGLIYEPFQCKWFWVPCCKVSYILQAIKNEK